MGGLVSNTHFEQKICQTTCPYCGVGCGVDVTVVDGEVTDTTGDLSHPANFGKLCIKGSNLAETTDHTGRLQTPEINGKPVTWQQVNSEIAQRFRNIIAQHGPDAIAFYVSGQLLTEDYYVANKFIKGFIGTANIDTNSRLCMSSAVAGYKRAFGADTVPCSYQDLEATDLLVLVGSNAAWTHPILFQRMERARAKNPNLKLVVIDPKCTATAELADLYLPVKPGSDVALFMGLLHYLQDNDAVDADFIANYCEGWGATLESTQNWNLEQTAKYCNLSIQDLETFYSLFSQAPEAVTFYSQGVNQSSQGVDKCNAIINCHLATGKVGRLGSGPFSITGQPNAMGGREVGGLANMLAAHMNIEDSTHRDLVQEFWQSPTICTKSGAKAVELFDKVESGAIKAIWIMATNPMVSMPNRQQIERALRKCDTVIVSDCMAEGDTLALADIKLPSTTWGEKDGTVTNSERRISRQKGVIAPPEHAKNDWRIICDVAVEMGYAANFNYQSPAEIFAEHAALSGYKNNSDGYPIRDFDISAYAQISQREYDNLSPKQWPINEEYPNGCQHIFAKGQFFTPSGKAQFIAVSPKAPKQQISQKYPLILNSGRYRDQWHTMSRTGKAKSLAKHINQPFLSIHPVDAKAYDICNNQLVEVSSLFGSVQLPAKLDHTVQLGNLFAPIHWNKTTASNANVSNCFGSFVDPISGQPESKFTTVNISKVTTSQHLHIFSTTEFMPQAQYWVKTKLASGYEYICQLKNALVDPLAWCKQHSEAQGTWSYFYDSEAKQSRIACLAQGKLQLVAFVSVETQSINSDWIESLLSSNPLSPNQLTQVLHGQCDPDFLRGKTVCTCFNIGEQQIIEAIIKDKDNTVEALGQRLRCGTNCGSCKTELAGLIKRHSDSAESVIPISQLD